MTATKAAVTKTAIDALLAKLSAFEAGHRPVGGKNNNLLYHDLLRQMLAAVSKSSSPSSSSTNITNRSKRQTPLVNAGYAARVAIMTFLIEEFVTYHSTTSSGHPINIVLIGCGLDVLSLYGYSLQPNTVRVYEIDCPEICALKHDALLSMDMLQSSTLPEIATTSGGQSVVHQGILKFPEVTTANAPNYVLVSADLKDTSSFQASLDSTLDTSCPTLIISELVLAYLGRNGCDNLLAYCASQICISPGSALIAYEPLGPEEEPKHHQGARILTVTDGYKRSYRKQFESKLQKGSATTTKEDKKDDVNVINKDANNDTVFHPLGISSSDVEQRMKHIGFSRTHACYAGTMAAAATSCRTKLRQPSNNDNPCSLFPAMEPFDEHAALALHLRSYVVLCAYAKGTLNEIECRMCPWSRKAAVGSLSVATESGILISHIEKCDQEQVRHLFANAYTTLFDEFPAVRKMVKTSLKSDLSDKTEDSLEPDNSTIGYRYMKWGGIFLVAIDKPTPDTRRVVGCVGLRPCKRGEGNIRGTLRHSYEIHRLAVDQDCRGKGIGRTLLMTVDRFISLSLGRPNIKFQIVATTPAILSPANELYQKMGFRAKEEKWMGKLQMNTYVKESTTKVFS